MVIPYKSIINPNKENFKVTPVELHISTRLSPLTCSRTFALYCTFLRTGFLEATAMCQEKCRDLKHLFYESEMFVFMWDV